MRQKDSFRFLEPYHDGRAPLQGIFLSQGMTYVRKGQDQIGNPPKNEKKGGRNFFQSIISVHATLAQKGNP